MKEKRKRGWTVCKKKRGEQSTEVTLNVGGVKAIKDIGNIIAASDRPN